MAISFPQFNVANNASAGSSLPATFTNPIAAGSFIAVIVTTDNGITSYSFSDGHGDAITDSGLSVVADASIGTKTQVAAFLSAATGAQTVTVTPNANFAFCELCIWEIAGLTGPIFDKAIQAAGVNSTASSTSTGTLSSANEAAIGYGISNGTYSVVGSGWTADSLPTTFGDIAEHQITSSTAAIAATATISTSTNFRMFCATFMSGGAAAPTPYNPWPQLGPVIAQRVWGWLPSIPRRPLWTPQRALWRPEFPWRPSYGFHLRSADAYRSRKWVALRAG